MWVWFDAYGHGSQILELNRLLSIDADIISIKILDHKKECDLKALLQALRVILDMKVEVVCLALAIDTKYVSEELRGFFEEISESGKIIVSALRNRHTISYPAALPNVIGVCMGSDPEHERYSYNKSLPIQCTLNIEPVILESLDGAYEIFNGNSLACALLSYHICSILKKRHYSFGELEDYLGQQKMCDLIFYDAFDTDIKLSNESGITEVWARLYDAFIDFGVAGASPHLLEKISSPFMLNQYIHCLKSSGLVINQTTFLRLSDLNDIHNTLRYLVKQRNLSKNNDEYIFF